MAARRRLDRELLRRGLVRDTEEVLALVSAGRILVGGSVAERVNRQVSAGEALVVVGPPPRYVGRGGLKLAGALKAFAIDPTDLHAIDIGASTGGFSDCLLQAGAARVVAVDVGHGQLHERLLAEPRIESMERTDIRTLDVGAVGGPFLLVTADLSFVPLRRVITAILLALAPAGDAVVLVKPQFEVSRETASRGQGVVRDPQAWREALAQADSAIRSAEAEVINAIVSPLKGARGNVEFFFHLRHCSGPGPSARAPIDHLVAQATPDLADTALT